MKKETKNLFLVSGILFLSFVLLLIAVLTIDVRPIGPLQSSIGLAGVNKFVFQQLGVNLSWYKTTDLLGMVAILTAAGFALLGVYQLITRKSIKAVDKDLFVLAGFYFAVILAYLLFEVFIVNYRPILVDGQLEASFPSSHTMLTLCIMSSAIVQFQKRVTNAPLKLVLTILSAVIMVATVSGRLLSGVHWFTDILGGVLLSAALIALYIASLKLLEAKQENALLSSVGNRNL